MTSHEQRHILVVEDEPDLVELVTLNLELAGYRVSSAPNGLEGLERARELQPDLVLLDVMMPVMDGWAVLNDLTADEAISHIPVVMLTALSDERDLIRGHLQGAVRYLTKPFEMRALLASVAEALEPATPEQVEHRRRQTRALLVRLAELDSGRIAADTPDVHLSRLEQRRPVPPPDGGMDRDMARATLDELTELQLHVLERLARGVGAREIARELDVSRSNVYALRKRIGRKLGVPPDDVADAAKRLLEAGD